MFAGYNPDYDSEDKVQVDWIMTRRFPGLNRVVSFLYMAEKNARLTDFPYRPLEEVGVSTTREFIELLDREDPCAMKFYTSLRDQLAKVK